MRFGQPAGGSGRSDKRHDEAERTSRLSYPQFENTGCRLGLSLRGISDAGLPVVEHCLRPSERVGAVEAWRPGRRPRPTRRRAGVLSRCARPALRREELSFDGPIANDRREF